MTMKNNRLCIPGRILDLLWQDDEFFREVISIKKAKLNNFPKYDHWQDQDGFHMEFALAGYSPEDITVTTTSDEIEVSSEGVNGEFDLTEEQALQILNAKTDKDESKLGEYAEYSKDAALKIQQGVIIRGIARRRFQSKFLVNSNFNLAKAEARMENGLLHILVPTQPEKQVNQIEIKK